MPPANLDRCLAAQFREDDGPRVVVTRAVEQAEELSSALLTNGFLPVACPLIAVAAPDDDGAALAVAIRSLSAYDWVVFASTNAVARTLGVALVPARCRVAAVGEATAEALRVHGVTPSLVPSTFTARALVEAFPRGNGEVLLPRAVDGDDALPEGLRAKGWSVDVVAAYRTVSLTPSPVVLAQAERSDVITFTSPSTVGAWVSTGGRTPPFVAAIGPVTEAAARRSGLEVHLVPSRHTVEGLVAALVEQRVRMRP